MNLLFARHGESAANLARVISNRNLSHGLTSTGVAQANALAELLAAFYDVRQIFASPIPRARETATIVGARLDLTPHIDPALREFDCGMMEGRGDAEAWAAHNAVIRAWDEAGEYDRRIPPDGESFNDMRSRFAPFVTRILAERKGAAGDVLLVAHGSMLHQMLPVVIDNIDRAFSAGHPLGTCQLVVAQPRGDGLICTRWADRPVPS